MVTTDDADEARRQRDPDGRHERRAARPLATSPTPNTRAAAIARTTLRRISRSETGGVCVRGPGGGATATGAGSGTARRARRRTRSRSPAGTSPVARSSDDSTTPTAMTARATPATRPTGRRATMAMSAATAPSVATIGATIETLPIVSAM